MSGVCRRDVVVVAMLLLLVSPSFLPTGPCGTDLRLTHGAATLVMAAKT